MEYRCSAAEFPFSIDDTPEAYRAMPIFVEGQLYVLDNSSRDSPGAGPQE